jgi:hypothetical protein
MSRRPIALSPDLLRLQNEGYDIEVRDDGFLLVRRVPYVDSKRTVHRTGILISKLKLVGDKTEKPDDHVAYWIGEHPCHADGSKIRAIENASGPTELGPGLRSDFTFSAKADYRDYHHKITTYVGRITGEATQIEGDAAARVYPVIPVDDPESVFKYIDTASSRAGISAVNAKVAGQRIGIAGLGGSGVYVLDFVAKTSVAEIRVIDGDDFSQHNAFRAPGAASLEQLQARPHKAPYFGALYSNMRNNIVVHDTYLDESNHHLLDGLDFVFICIDRGPIKRALVARLTANGTPFVDLGMGVVMNDGQLSGIVRTTISTPETRDAAAPHISYSEGDGEINEYATNIQIAELNALNAIMAVMCWKRHFGIYETARPDVYAGYSIRRNEIITDGDA